MNDQWWIKDIQNSFIVCKIVLGALGDPPKVPFHKSSLAHVQYL